MTVNYRVVPFKRWHLKWLETEGTAPGNKGPVLDDLTLEYLERAGSWTGVVDGKPIACAGFVEQWPGRTIAWACMSQSAGRHMRWITRQVKLALAKVHGRIEMTVRSDFDAGHRWAKMLGFEMETPYMKGYGPEGEPHVGYMKWQP